jgi:hypothetical protein
MQYQTQEKEGFLLGIKNLGVNVIYIPEPTKDSKSCLEGGCTYQKYSLLPVSNAGR